LLWSRGWPRRRERRIRATEVSRERDMEEEEVETAELAAGPHIETKKWKHMASGVTILGMLTANGGTWRGENGRVCNLCRRLNQSCVWRQDNKKVKTCYFCQRGKTSCTMDAEAGLSKKAKELEPEPEEEDEDEERVAPSATNKLLADILEEQQLHNERVLAEISHIRGALFQVTKHLKCLVNNANDIADHLMSEDDKDGRWIVGGKRLRRRPAGRLPRVTKKGRRRRRKKRLRWRRGQRRGRKWRWWLKRRRGR